jgi:phage gp29-like protein
MADAKGIYLPNGEFMPFRMESLTTEIATRQNAGATLADMGQWLDQLPDPDPILRKRGDDARILAELYTDDQVTTATLARKNRVLNAPEYGFRPGGPDGEPVTPEAQNVYDRLSQDLERVSLRPLISSILDAPFYGMAPLELVWGFGADGWWHLVDIVARPYHWFAYDTNNQPYFRGEMGWAATTPEPLPVGKFVIVTHHATYDNPYGLRLLSRCLWPVAFKRGGLQFYAAFVERHGMPWVVGKASKGAGPQDKRRMAADMARMVRDCVAVIPAGADVTFMTPGATQAALHEQFIARQDKAISKLLMGQTLTVEMEGRNNSQAAATTHEDVAEGLADADKAMVADAMNELAWLYTQVNAGKGVFAPLFSYEEPEDLHKRAELDKLLVEIGVSFTTEHFTDNYNLKPSEFTMRAAAGNDAGGFAPGAAPGPSFAAAPGKSAYARPPLAEKAQANLDAAIKKILPDALKASGEFINRIEKAVKNAESLDALELALADLLAPKTTPSELEDLLARTMTAAAGFGAAAVRAEADEDRHYYNIKDFK